MAWGGEERGRWIEGGTIGFAISSPLSSWSAGSEAGNVASEDKSKLLTVWEGLEAEGIGYEVAEALWRGVGSNC